ncbi:hypothetical protein OAG68_00395 [bacterium]|nr:hypothetical protein [bacterium]
MRSRRSNNAYAVTLFPFLAVLICTMGVLVALLVVAVHAADQSARKETAEVLDKKAAELKEVRFEVEENAFRVEGLAEFRPEVLERLKAARETRAHLQDSLKEIENDALLLANQLQQLEQEPNVAPEVLAQFEAEEVELKHRILAGREQLEQLEKQKPAEQVVYSIVPTTASGVTNRRPIYIECVGDRLVLQPHGITFLLRDFLPPIEVGNPLDAAMIAIRNYWDEHQLSGSEGDAYPLLIVRPSGAQAYALARHAIQSWDDEFGYELITEDLELDFGVRDNQLEQEVQLAISEAQRRQDRRSAIAMSAGNGFGGNGGGLNKDSQYTGLSVDHTNGGFVSNEASGEGRERQASNWSGQSGTVANGGRRTVSSQSQPSEQNAQQQSQASGAEGGSASGNSLESVAQSKGQDWALPSRTRGGTIYRRPITITCSADQLVIASGASLDDQPKVLMMNGETAEAVDPLVNEVWQKIKSWGFAGAGGYWKPELRFRVTRDGMQRARDLAVLLEGSGLDLKFSETP